MENISGVLQFILRSGAFGGSPDRVIIALHNKFPWGGAHLNGYHWGNSGTIRRGPETPKKKNSDIGW